MPTRMRAAIRSRNDLAAAGLTVSQCGGFDEQTTGWEIRGGLQALRYVGFSVGYGRVPALTRVDSGPFGTSGNLIFKDVATVSAVKSLDLSFEAHATFGVVSPYVRYGWAHSTFTETLNQSIRLKSTDEVSREQEVSKDFDGWNPVYGAGVSVAFTRCFDIAAGWRRLKLSDSGSSFHYNQWTLSQGITKGFGRLK
jgi:hypothetical protein